MKNYHSDNIYVSELLLKVEDINRAKEFYQSIMGFKILDDKGKEVVLTVNGQDPIITLVEPENVKAKESRRTGIYHIAILVPDIIELGLFLKNIREQSYPIRGGSNHGVSNAIYLDDPDDNGIEVYADLDPSKWNREDDRVEMVTLPLDYDKLVGDTGDKNWEGASSTTKIGHIHLHVNDIDEADKFYIEGLGLTLTSKISKHASFYSSKGYHHHIAANIWNGRGALPLDENSVGMKYYTINFPNEDSLMETYERLKDMGYVVWEKDGEKFVEDPAKNLIRFVVN